MWIYIFGIFCFLLLFSTTENSKFSKADTKNTNLALQCRQEMSSFRKLCQTPVQKGLNGDSGSDTQWTHLYLYDFKNIFFS